MKARQIRTWLGLYTLILTAAVGGYLLLVPAELLPLERPDRVAAFEIIVPFLLGQVAAVFHFYSDPQVDRRRAPVTIPTWVIVGPPLIVSALLIAGFASLASSGLRGSVTGPTPEDFKALLTFCVAILNASTILVIGRYFDSRPNP